MATLEELQSRLAEANTALHAWRTGKQAVTYRDSNGEAVTYSVSAMSGLPAYIAELQRQINQLLGIGSYCGPLRVFM